MKKTVLIITVLLLAGTVAWSVIRDAMASPTPPAAAHNAGAAAPDLHPVTIRRPDGKPVVLARDASGQTLEVRCGTCHTTRTPNPQNQASADLDEFHQGLNLAHGTLTCLSCHNSNDYESLKLADGRKVEFADVMNLCAQCHGTHYRDYQNGSHGGMTGYWDLTRGPRTRNNCINCHDPHAPAYMPMQPTFKPRDRFLEQGSGEKH